MNPNDIQLISVVIPAKNEEKRIGLFLQAMASHVKQSPYAYEIIVVDDGSSDKTSEIALRFQREFPEIRAIRNHKNYGKGFAVRKGFFLAKGDIVLFLDADGAVGPGEVEKNLHYFFEGYDIVIGSRELSDPDAHRDIKRARRIIGRIFHCVIRSFLHMHIVDTQCGFKMFTRAAVDEIFPFLRCDGFAFDIEILSLASKKKRRVKETAVSWKHISGSHINFLLDPFRMVYDALCISIRHAFHQF